MDTLCFTKKQQYICDHDSGGKTRLIFSRASRTLRGATQVVTFLSVRDRKKCVGGPIAVQSLLVPCMIYTVRA